MARPADWATAGDGVRVVGHGDVSAARQHVDTGARRKLVQVAGLVPEQQPVTGAQCDGHRRGDGCSGQVPACGRGPQRCIEGRAGAHRGDGCAGIPRCQLPGPSVGLAEDQGTPRAVGDQAGQQAGGAPAEPSGGPEADPVVHRDVAAPQPGRDSRVSEAAGRMVASSSAAQPPSEFPARCAVVTPRSSSSPATAAAKVAGSGSSCAGRGPQSPNPGRSTAMMSNCSARAGSPDPKPAQP